MSSADKAKRHLLAIEIPRDELAYRIAVQCLGVRPTMPMTATAALDQIAAIEPDMIRGFRAAADAAILYFHECIQAGRQPN